MRNSYYRTVESLLSRMEIRGRINGCIEECSNEDLDVIRGAAMMDLPEAYLAVMKQCGRGCGKLYHGSTFFFPEMLEADKTMRLCVDADESLNLDNDMWFCFAMHQGYEFLFFFLNEGSNPQVLYYCDGSGEVCVKGSTFLEFFEKAFFDFNG